MITHRRARRTVVAALFGTAALTGCSDGLAVSLSDPQTVTARTTASADASPTADEPSTDPQPSPDAVSPDQPSTRPVGRPARAWGGGTRVGTFPTRGTVVGDDGSGRQKRVAVGTCDLAHDVRTVTVTLERDAVLVIDVTGPNVGSLTLKAPGDPVRTVEYVGDVTPVITLTPTRTEVRGALLVPPAGSAAPAVRLDASFDC